MHQFSRDRGDDDGDDEEEQDVMGLLFQNTSEDDFPPPSGLGKSKGKGKSRAASMDARVESPISFGAAAAAGTRIRKKTWRKALADGDDQSHEEGPHAHAISAPVVLDARPKKRRRIISSSSTWGSQRSATIAGARHSGLRCAVRRSSHRGASRAGSSSVKTALRNGTPCNPCLQLQIMNSWPGAQIPGLDFRSLRRSV